MKIEFSIYRYNPTYDNSPYMQDYTINNLQKGDMTILDALIKIKEQQDSSLSFRRSCREGVCGSDGININGKNGLACITSLSFLYKKKKKIILRPLPGLPVIRDLVVDMTIFYQQYAKIKPFLIRDDHIENIDKEYYQSPEDRAKLDGLYECILCACCSASCPSFWWNPDKFIGPAGLLTAYRFLSDTRDTAHTLRLKDLNNAFSVFRCHSIMNCVSVCPKGLNPTKAIHNIKRNLIHKN